ncbi:Pr6Pr family membrane protein [Leptospira idonii]|uniref:FAR-17a/AIG1-like protein n=1 Tax=Leptospira idonii TaxID=1193500 RepID=A0A4R9LZ43_9LEPT|nr:Pr6Pr family membrane protein [Leptospira idonii]TGN19623.1 hypothetical protein EHS15_07505 [Leptospira idonii]
MRSLFIFQFISSVICIFTLGAQLALSLTVAEDRGSSYGLAVINYFSYMTIWTNILIAAYFFLPLTFPKSKLNEFLHRSTVETGILVYILIVGIVYHLLLSGVWNPQGLQYIVDINLHSTVPLLYIVYWLMYIEKGNQVYKNAFFWLLYPMIYAIYIFIRGEIIHIYPYPFTDVLKLGYAVSLRNFLFLSLAYYILGIFIVAIDRLFFRLKTRHGR